MTPIERAIESTKNRIHYLTENSKDGTPRHCQKAEKQEEIQKVILEALEKQIPVRLKQKCKSTFEQYESFYGVCLCGARTRWNQKYCGDCGKPLIWDDEISKESN